MKRVFIASDGYGVVFPRTLAMGHKQIIIDESVEVTKPVELHTNNTDLVMSQVPETEDATSFTILCKEFGLVENDAEFKNKISIIFCDNGWMLVTLMSGALVVNLNNELLMPSTLDVTPPVVKKENILWVNANELLTHCSCFGMKGDFAYDFEWVLTINGNNNDNNTKLSIRHESNEDIDISLGYFAKFEQHLQAKENMKRVASIMSIIPTGGSSMEFDDDGVDDSEVVDEDEEDNIYGL